MEAKNFLLVKLHHPRTIAAKHHQSALAARGSNASATTPDLPCQREYEAIFRVAECIETDLQLAACE